MCLCTGACRIFSAESHRYRRYRRQRSNVCFLQPLIAALHNSKPTCDDFLRQDLIPFGLRFPEDFVACSLVTQAVIGHENRLVT